MAITVNEQLTATSYTLSASDDETQIVFGSNSAITVFCPGTLLQGVSIVVTQSGQGTVTFVEDGTGTFLNAGDVLTRAPRAYVAISLEADGSYAFNGAMGSDKVLTASNYAGAVAPQGYNDDSQGYSVGSRWFDTVAQTVYECLDASTGAAVWILSSNVSTALNSVSTGTGISNSGTISDPILDNDGVLALTSGTNVSIAGTNSNKTISVPSVGVTSVSAGTGVTIGGTATDPIINSTGGSSSAPTIFRCAFQTDNTGSGGTMSLSVSTTLVPKSWNSVTGSDSFTTDLSVIIPQLKAALDGQGQTMTVIECEARSVSDGNKYLSYRIVINWDDGTWYNSGYAYDVDNDVNSNKIAYSNNGTFSPASTGTVSVSGVSNTGTNPGNDIGNGNMGLATATFVIRPSDKAFIDNGNNNNDVDIAGFALFNGSSFTNLNVAYDFTFTQY